MAVTVVSASGATLTRVGIAAAFEGAPDLRLVGAAASGAEALALLGAQRPDVVLLDLDLTDGNGLTWGAEVRRSHPALGIVLLAARDDDLLLRALEAGISAFLPRTEELGAILAAVRHAAAAPSSFTAPDLAGALSRRRHSATVVSPREREVLNLLREGLTVPQIATALGLSESTVKTYLARIYDKLGVTGREQAVIAATDRGLLAGQ
ncbi:response regulator transcription factor [Catenuloplanes atrovinosus]|uniref:DNA-binding NarL/FixJ family response regulator n=1 Tax=Catenuloplanes atrovinosus TaxID=137266 RepID=A0AAE3YWE4_9ACTN|nr:response regulator transcription factor [Catenuloplanes atrovinosus]MDR7279992.1 DNA-binding NarL/FixJ family response regulator [Catenuloplanes atrovinosus]